MLRHRRSRLPEPTDPVYRALLKDTTTGIQWFELARREIIPERFK